MARKYEILLFPLFVEFVLKVLNVMPWLTPFQYTQIFTMEPRFEMILTMVMAFIAYSIADLAGLSGVLAIFVFGLIARHYLVRKSSNIVFRFHLSQWYNLRKGARKHIDVFFYGEGVRREPCFPAPGRSTLFL